MNTFTKIKEEGGNLFLVIETIDPQGNKVINYRISNSEEEFQTIVDEVVAKLTTSLNECEIQLKNLPTTIENLNSQINQITNL